MLDLYFSFKGRLSVPQFWQAFWLLGVLVAATAIPAFLLVLLGAQSAPLAALAVCLAVFVGVGVGCSAIAVKRAHDLDRPGRWVFMPFSGYKLAFWPGDLHPNRYGPMPSGSLAPLLPVWRITGWAAGVALVSIVASGVLAIE